MVGVLIISTIFLTFCEDEMENINLKGERTKTYTITPKNQVGTDEDFKQLWGNSAVPLRTVTAHNDGNCVYVAPNGNDGNAGTSALPKLTIQNAITTAIGAGKAIVTVIRNGYVGNIVFTENVEIVDTMTLQVEAGETATIQDNSGGNISFKQSNTVIARDILSLIRLSNGWILAGCSTAGAGINSLYTSNDEGLTWAIGTDADLNNRTIWKFIQLANGNIICGGSSAAGVSAIKISGNNGVTWAEATGAGLDNKLVYGLFVTITGRILASTSVNEIYYSDDNGNTWTASATVMTTVSFRFIYTANNRILSGMYYSDNNGLTWSQNPNINNQAMGLIRLPNNTLVASINGDIYKSVNEGNTWTSKDIVGVPITELLLLKNGDILATTGNVGFYISSDFGDNWTISAPYFGGLQYSPIELPNGRVVVGNSQGIYYSANTEIVKQFDNTKAITINGFILDGNNNKVFGAYTKTLKWCHLKNMYQGLYFDNAPTILNNIFENLYNGCVSKNGDYQQNLFYNITNFAVQLDSNTTTFTFKHNTIYLAYIGVLIEGIIATCTLENNLIHKCSGYAISSIVTQLTALNSIIYNQMYNVLAGVQTVLGFLNPLFKSPLLTSLGDYRIQTTEDGYSANSIAKQNANDSFGGYSYDSGAYLITRALFSDIFGLDITPDFPPYDLSKSFVLTNFQQKDTANGDVSKYFDGYRIELTYTQKKGTIGSDLFTSQVMRLMRSSNPMRLIPHTAGVKSGVGSFDATLLTLTLSSDTFVGRDKTTAVIDMYEGWGIKIVANATTYYFRVTSHTDTVITLENIEGYTGMANDTAATYMVEFLPVKCVNPTTEFASEVAGEGFTNLGFIFNDTKRIDSGHNLKFVQTYWC
jgi:hypothetical protein